jgi:hypothetical protein
MKVLSRPVNRVVIETWNEFHEGTDIAESNEYGRQYIELTAKYAKLFKDGIRLQAPPSKFGALPSVSISLSEVDSQEGIVRIDNEDGVNKPIMVDDRFGRRGIPNKGGMYIYFGVDDDWMSYGKADVEAVIEYCDIGKGVLVVQYDSNDSKATLGGAYTNSKSIVLTDSGKWKRVVVSLKNVKFAGRQNGGADLRVAIPNTEVVLGRITLSKLPEQSNK